MKHIHVHDTYLGLLVYQITYSLCTVVPPFSDLVQVLIALPSNTIELILEIRAHFVPLSFE